MGFREILAKYADTIWMLNDEEQHDLFVALVEYAEDGTLPEEQGNEKYVFSMMRKEMDEERPEKPSRSEINSDNAKRGWEKRRANKMQKCENANRILHKKEDSNDAKTQEICLFDANDANCISHKNQAGEKESVPSPLSPSLSSPEPPSNTPPIIPQPLKEKESRTKKKAEQKPKHKHGEYGHVLLTDEEFDRLAADFGQGERDFQIQMMDEYAELNRKNYDNWNLAIRKAKREGWFDRQRGAVKPFTGNKQTQERKEAKLREYDEMTRKTFEALGFDYGSNT